MTVSGLVCLRGIGLTVRSTLRLSLADAPVTDSIGDK
jgi:hypothetical protein